MNGFVLVDKPQGPSSHAAVQQVRRALGIGGRRGTRAGHAGTLDPFASGLLLVLVGRATRLMPWVVGHDKRYLVDVRFGASSSTDDRTGELSASGAAQPDRATVDAALARLAATNEQVPPAVSAIHVDGERAYRRVRRGEEVDVPARPVRFHSIELVDWSDATDHAGALARLDVRCSTGTYMRALARDLGEAVGVPAYCDELRRTEVGSWSVEGAPAPDAVAVADVRDASALLDTIPTMRLDDAELAAVASGRRIMPRASMPAGTHVALLGPDGTLAAMAEVSANSQQLQPRTVLVDPATPGMGGSSS